MVNADQTIAQTLDRDRMMVVQTPQCFEPGLIKGALTSAIKNKIPLTDDCSAIEALGIPVHLIPGEKANIKITTPEDLLLAETIIKQLTLNN